MKYTLPNILIVSLICSLSILIIVIAYRKLIRHLGKDYISKEDFCVLYSLETDIASDIIEIYFTASKPRTVQINLLDASMKLMQVIKEGEFSTGGHIVRFDTKSIEDGYYFFSLQTDNQHTMKKMTVRNPK
ncbi:MAG: hypothetical protein V4638_08845 [Bacteroidota bacterium]